MLQKDLLWYISYISTRLMFACAAVLLVRVWSLIRKGGRDNG
jgi:hypothetical protein